jgi:hypothetical protein
MARELVLAGLLAGCGSHEGGSSAAGTALKTASDGNFVLYVSDQSFALGQVDITVRIDGRVAVSDEFAVGNEHKRKQYRSRSVGACTTSPPSPIKDMPDSQASSASTRR